MSEVPNHLDRFEILRVLGQGGMGTVYLARDQRLGRQVALKVLNPDDLASEDRRARFLREARASASIRHPNVATIYEVDETEDGKPFIVMEYCEGETLSQRMRRRPLEAGEFVSIARQIAAGVAAAHDTASSIATSRAANIIIEPNGHREDPRLRTGEARSRASTTAAVDMPSADAPAILRNAALPLARTGARHIRPTSAAISSRSASSSIRWRRDSSRSTPMRR